MFYFWPSQRYSASTWPRVLRNVNLVPRTSLLGSTMSPLQQTTSSPNIFNWARKLCIRSGQSQARKDNAQDKQDRAAGEQPGRLFWGNTLQENCHPSTKRCGSIICPNMKLLHNWTKTKMVRRGYLQSPNRVMHVETMYPVLVRPNTTSIRLYLFSSKLQQMSSQGNSKCLGTSWHWYFFSSKVHFISLYQSLSILTVDTNF